MKKTLVSLATASLIVTSAMAADKGIDIVTTGQAVVYYETMTDDSTGKADLFDQANSVANVGVQLNLGADLGNNFTFGSQISYLGTLGLENNLVSNTKQGGGQGLEAETDTQLMLTKIFVAKKVGNTTVKLGRQELPKSLSPLAFSEGWNVFKNTFDAALVVNSDIPDTTLVGAYVGNTMGSTGTYGTMATLADAGAYMLTAQNKSIPMTTVTATYYRVTHTADAIFASANVAGKDLPLGLKVGLQYGSIAPDAAGAKDTDALGAKVALAPIDALTVQLAYSQVDEGTVNMANLGTGVKTPLFTQMVYNQSKIDNDANTIVGKVVYNTGDYGKIIAQYGATSDESVAGNDYAEFDLMYKIKSAGVQYFAAYINRDIENTAPTADVKEDRIRVWARLNF